MSIFHTLSQFSRANTLSPSKCVSLLKPSDVIKPTNSHTSTNPLVNLSENTQQERIHTWLIIYLAQQIFYNLYEEYILLTSNTNSRHILRSTVNVKSNLTPPPPTRTCVYTYVYPKIGYPRTTKTWNNPGLNNGGQNELHGVNGRQKSYVCNCANNENNNNDNNVSGNNVVCQISTLITRRCRLMWGDGVERGRDGRVCICSTYPKSN